ncbi:MAG TPA: LytTR family transcriptional regulator [Rhodobacteraceae bacterium]|nr:LytTR family transcriptional regulator [Paracoccaceae bacterium]
MKSTALHLTLRKIHEAFTAPKVLGGIFVVAVVLGVSGPFQTFEAFALPVRLGYWLLVSVLTFGAGFFAGTYVEIALQRRFSEWPRFLAASLATALAVVIVVFLINLLSFQDALFSLETMLLLGAYVAVISFAISAAFKIFTPQNAAPAEAPLLARLPFDKRAQLISLSVQDHYTEITTAKGSELVLMRLSDAIKEADGGLQIHRSHWVATKAIAKVERQAGKVVLTTVVGSELPVSRTYLPVVKAAGFLP